MHFKGITSFKINMAATIKDPLFTKLVLSGGGPRGLAILGALHYADERGFLAGITEYYGTSVGSVISLLLLIGYTPFDAFHHFFMIDQIASSMETLDFKDMIEQSALCPIEVFGNKVRRFLEQKLGPGVDPTFAELHARFGKKLHVFGANTTTMRGECFNVDTCPNMKVSIAIEISCDLPYIFTKKNYNGQVYVDGGFINNYPINLADNGIDHILGFCVFGEVQVAATDYIGWIYRLLYMPIMELYRDRIQRLSDKCTHVELIVDGVSAIEITPPKKKKVRVFSSGYQQCRAFFTERDRAIAEIRGKISAVAAAAASIEGENEWEEWDPDFNSA